MLYGTDWIPIEWRDVQDHDCIVLMTELLQAENRKEATATKTEVAEVKTPENGWKKVPIGKIKFVEKREVPNGKNGVVLIEKWLTALGQTLYTKNFKPFDNSVHSKYHSSAQMELDMQHEHSTEVNNTMTAAKFQEISIENVHLPNNTVNREKQFVLDPGAIQTLLENKAEFKENVTVGKVLKVVQALMETEDTNANIAKRCKLDENMVKLLREWIK